MLSVLLALLPGMRAWWAGIGEFGVGEERDSKRIALTTCTSTIKSYFPCPQTSPPNSTCLCDQHLYLTTCLENHVSYPPSHPNRVIIETTTKEHCRAAGSIAVERVRRVHEQQRRQIGSLISSIVGDVSSVLSSKGVTVPTAVIESVAGSVLGALPTVGEVDPTSIAAEVTASRGESSMVVTSAAITGLASSIESTPTPTQRSSSSTAIADSASSSNSSSGPSTGRIAGVVVGGIAALALIGIFVLLLLRHRKKKASRRASLADKEASPTMSSLTEYPSPPTNTNNTFPARPLQTTYPSIVTPQQRTTPSTYTPPGTLQSPISPLTEDQQTPWPSVRTTTAAPAPRYSPSSYDNDDNDEKPSQHHQFYDAKVPLENEMPTQANVWEIGGREIPRPSELEAGERDGLDLGDVGGGQRSARDLQDRDTDEDIRRDGGVGVAL